MGDVDLQEKLGRNDLCPCGSGKRYKRCCLKQGRYDGSLRDDYFQGAPVIRRALGSCKIDFRYAPAFHAGEVGVDADARAGRQIDLPVLGSQRPGEHVVSERVLVDVDLQEAAAAGGRQGVGGVEEADAAR